MKKPHNKDGPEPDVSFVDSMHSHNTSAAKPRDDTGRKPRDETAGRPRDGTGRKPRDETAGRPRDGTGRKPRDETAGRPRDGTGRKPRDETARRPRDGTRRKLRDNYTGRPRDGTGKNPRDVIIKLEERFETLEFHTVTKLPCCPQIRGKTILRRLKILGVNHPSGVVMAKLCPEVNEGKITEKGKLELLVTHSIPIKTTHTRMKSRTYTI